MPEEGDTLLEFPCRFPIKVMGKAEEGFESLVVEIVRRHSPDFDDTQVRVRQSSGGKWLSVTVTIEATGKDQLDAIYRELTSHERVAWVL